MGSIISIINQKGGVGKTTTTLCLAEGLTRRGYKTLLVDLDQQQNASKQYGVIVENHVTVYDLLTTSDVDAREGIQKREFSDIIAGDSLIVGVEAEMASLTCRETMLSDALEPLKDDYDFILIDCSPSLGIVATNALVASDKVIVPINCDGYSTDGFEKLYSLIERIQSNRRLNPQLEISGFLITAYEQSHRLSKAYDRDLPEFANSYDTKVYSTKIRRCCKTKEAQQKGVSLIEYAPDCTTVQDYMDFVDELIKEA